MMAFGSQSLRRLHSVGACNAEGLEMKLSDYVQPTSEILLPHHISIVESSVSLNSQYPFEVEETFLNWVKDVAEIEKERILADENEQKRRVNEENGGNTLDPDVEENQKGKAVNKKDGCDEGSAFIPPVQANLSTDILIPTPTDSNKEAELNSDHESNHIIDLADFENVASDPFEAAELQTLNDIEELRSVLASSTAPTPLPELYNPPPVDTNFDIQMPSEERVRNLTEEVHIKNKLEAVTFKRSKLHNNLKSDLCPRDLSYMDHDDLSESLDNFMLHSSSDSPIKNPLPAIAPSTKTALLSTASDVNKNEDISESNQRKRGVTPDQDNTSPANPRPNFPPGYPRNLNKYSPLPPTPSTGLNAETSFQKENLENSGLDEEGQNFVMTITSMGFPLHRTARVVKRLGHDDKLVIDTLCAIDRLCSKGFMEDKVELALNLLDGDEDKVSNFLKLWKRFEELGFKSDDIKRELLLHGNEEEKVLNALTAKT